MNLPGMSTICFISSVVTQFYDSWKVCLESMGRWTMRVSHICRLLFLNLMLKKKVLFVSHSRYHTYLLQNSIHFNVFFQEKCERGVIIFACFFLCLWHSEKSTTTLSFETVNYFSFSCLLVTFSFSEAKVDRGTTRTFINQTFFNLSFCLFFVCFFTFLRDWSFSLLFCFLFFFRQILFILF